MTISSEKPVFAEPEKPVAASGALVGLQALLSIFIPIKPGNEDA
jgi:hypothetical protein